MLINDVLGKYVKKGVMEPVGVCDRTGFMFSKSDLIKEYEWAGDELIWNGLLVGRPFVDTPNPFFKTPEIKADPYPVEDPRPPAWNPPSIDVPSEKTREITLETVDFTKESPVPRVIPNIMGQDCSKVTNKERIKILNNINFNQ